ncbi:hypothetical protein C5F48_12025 [Cereibacter changlensis JA139]|uniref:Alginate biosynthesis protein AlgF n=2 Tax=Cereibacter changlensis TaxID=402884 RepID=A0A2T4JUN8_9RHOB|nr:hypothetical protein [Cereibacter changlensis]PTE21483.1 hypothetical protein C5F48_12025 [Cereibacter changlensis JA139]PZX52853.1 hypothetical protein LX76_02484 [Cereibacter changlensis]
MRMIWQGLAVSLLMGTGAQAGALSDAIFAPGAFGATDPGQVTRYDHERSGPEGPGFRPVAQGALVITPELAEGKPQLVLTHEDAGRTAPVAAFAASAGDPVLLYFLENTVRSMAALTGGSPFYIRNRVRDALVQAETAVGEGPVVAEVKPFSEDPNREKMGAFADLVLRFELTPGAAVPLSLLSADTTAAGGAYRETLTLEGS